MDSGKGYRRVLWPAKRDKTSFRVRVLTCLVFSFFMPGVYKNSLVELTHGKRSERIVHQTERCQVLRLHDMAEYLWKNLEG